MREIMVDLDVFSALWAQRRADEMTENDILRRLLEVSPPKQMLEQRKQTDINRKRLEQKEVFTSKLVEEDMQYASSVVHGKIRWVDDVLSALKALGGEATLHEIYKRVEELRISGGRSVPKSFHATIRRTIEDHSSDSENFRGSDYFRKVARGVWGLRK